MAGEPLPDPLHDPVPGDLFDVGTQLGNVDRVSESNRTASVHTLANGASADRFSGSEPTPINSSIRR